MNRIEQHEFGILDATSSLRDQMMDMLTNADLDFAFAKNPTLGDLCKGMGDVELSYIDSFKTYKQDWSICLDDPQMAHSVEKLKSWYKQLDTDLKAALSAIPAGDVDSKTIDRGGFTPPVGVQFHVYREALLIFYGKVTVYLNALGKPLPERWQMWIG